MPEEQTPADMLNALQGGEPQQEAPNKESQDLEAFQKIESQGKKAAEAEKAEAPEEGEGQEQEKSEDPSIERRVRRLKEKLKLAGVPGDVVDGIDDRDRLEDWWSQYEDRENERNRILEENAELRKRSEAADPEEDESSQDDRQNVPFDLYEEAFKEQFGEEGAELLMDFASRIQAPADLEDVINQRVEERLAQYQQQVSIQDQLKSNRDRLGESFPQLVTSEAAWNAVVNAATALAEQDPTSFSTVDEAIDQAAYEIYGSQAQVSKSKEAEVEEEPVKTPAPTRPQKRSKPRDLSTQEQDRAIFDQLGKGKTVGEAQRLAGVKARKPGF